MAREKALTDDRLADLWRAVKEQDGEGFWDEVRAEQLRTTKRIIEGALEVEMIAHLAAGRYERGGQRRGWRNGYYQRNILLDLGLIEGLRIPRARASFGGSALIERFRQRQGRVNQLVREAFLALADPDINFGRISHLILGRFQLFIVGLGQFMELGKGRRIIFPGQLNFS